MKHTKFQKTMKSYLSSLNKQLDNSLLLVSGGVDSMSLLHFFIENNLTCQVLHINHQTRDKDNLLEANLIKRVCSSQEIKYHYHVYQHQSGNFQAMARAYRYDLACQIVAAENLEQIITAHHRDDLVENILMYSEKINFRGIQEISNYQNCQIYRPLLSVYKEQIYNYAKVNHVDYNEDFSNQDNKYKRNLVRNEQVKFLKEDAKEQIIAAEVLRLEQMPERLTELSVDTLLNYQKIEQEYLLYNYLKSFGVQQINKKTLQQIIKSMKKFGMQTYTLSNNQQLQIIYGIFKLEIVKKNNIVTWQQAQVGINTFNQIRFSNDLKSVWITTRKPGDKIQINGVNKKLSRLMIEYKIPQNKRDSWPIICDQNRNLLYLPKSRKT